MAYEILRISILKFERVLRLNECSSIQYISISMKPWQSGKTHLSHLQQTSSGEKRLILSKLALIMSFCILTLKESWSTKTNERPWTFLNPTPLQHPGCRFHKLSLNTFSDRNSLLIRIHSKTLSQTSSSKILSFWIPNTDLTYCISPFLFG